MASNDEARRRPIATTLLRIGGSTAAGVADAVTAAWRQIDVELSPIIGPAGVAALYRRSVHLNLDSVQAVAVAGDPTGRLLDPAPLRDALARLDAPQAAALGGDVLQTFHDLLTGMVGESLTHRLLRPVWADLSGDAPTKDDSQ